MLVKPMQRKYSTQISIRMFGQRYLGPLLVLCMLASYSEAWGQAAEADVTPSDAVSYTTIDASTLRVFSLGTVGVETLEGNGFSVQVAAPKAGHGTGFAIDSELIITAEHVVHGGRHVVVRLPGEGGFLPARVVYSDEAEDIAVLHVDANLTPIRMASDSEPLRVRQTVFAVGYPLDPSRTQAQSAKGIIAGHLKDNSLQLGMSLNPGNSGGPLVDESDRVVGMVIARGDVEKGVQGIGVAVPIAKLQAAVARARQELSSGKIPAISVHDTMSAEVVDGLISQGTLTSVEEAGDLKKGFVGQSIKEEIEEIANRLNDADLLVFVAGSLWNASLIVRYGGVREVGGETLSEEEAHTLAYDLRAASIRLTKLAGEIDPSISSRSGFVAVALSRNADRFGVGSFGYGGFDGPSPTKSRWTLNAYPHLRMNASADGGWGFGVEAKQQTKSRKESKTQWFGSWGTSMGRVTLDSADTESLVHSFYALELGMGLSRAIGESSHLEFYGGIAPSYYSSSAVSLSGMSTSESGVVLDHFRATISLTMGRWNLNTGARLVSSTVWLEPFGVGLNF